MGDEECVFVSTGESVCGVSDINRLSHHKDKLRVTEQHSHPRSPSPSSAAACVRVCACVCVCVCV